MTSPPMPIQCWQYAFQHVPDLLGIAAGLRIDPDMNSGSRMSYYTGLTIVDMSDDLVLPAPREATTPITGYPEGFWINLVSWSQDGKHIAFTVRSPGELVSTAHYFPVMFRQEKSLCSSTNTKLL